jgi:hypothetical protein
MRSNPVESAPRDEFIILQDDRQDSDVYEIARWSAERSNWIGHDGEPIELTPSHWLPIDYLCRLEQGASRGWRRFGMHAVFFVAAGLAMMFAPSALNNWAGLREKESLFVAGSFQDAGNSPTSAITYQQAAEQERQQIEALARQLAQTREDVGTLTARVSALTDARTEVEKVLQTAQTSAAAQKLALEEERQRGDALVRELASAREEVEARKAAANAADASAKNAQASATEQAQSAEQERQRGEVLAHQLALARVDIETLTARVAFLTEERSEAEKALQTTQASAAEQKLTLEQERQRGDIFIRQPSSAREEVEARTAAANAANASAKNAHTFGAISARGSNGTNISSRSMTAVSKSPAPSPNLPSAVSVARPDEGPGNAQGVPASMRSDQGTPPALRDLSRQAPPQRLIERRIRDFGNPGSRQGQGTGIRQNYSSIRLFGD